MRLLFEFEMYGEKEVKVRMPHFTAGTTQPMVPAKAIRMQDRITSILAELWFF
jgi:hypothetical protein